MEDAQGFLGHPEVGFFSMLLIGVIAGWIAEKVTESDRSIFANILVGIAGSTIGNDAPRRDDDVESPDKHQDCKSTRTRRVTCALMNCRAVTR